MSGKRLFAEFDTPDALLEAAERMHAADVEPMDAATPYPVPGLDDVLGLRRSRLPLLVFTCGIAGGVTGLGIQWFTNAWDYPINVGGRPLLAWPAWIPVAFELTVLGAATGAVLGLLIATGLPRLWRPAFEIDDFERVTNDRFWLIIDIRDNDVGTIRHEIEAAGARRIAIIDEDHA